MRTSWSGYDSISAISEVSSCAEMKSRRYRRPCGGVLATTAERLDAISGGVAPELAATDERSLGNDRQRDKFILGDRRMRDGFCMRANMGCAGIEKQFTAENAENAEIFSLRTLRSLRCALKGCGAHRPTADGCRQAGSARLRRCCR